MWSRQLFLVGIFTLTILTTQSHVIHKRGLLSKVFGGSSKSTRNVDADMSPREQSKLRELLKNPIVITMLSAAVGMVVQQALASRNKGDLCDNKYVKMAYMAGNINPQLQQALNMLGCNGPNRKHGTNNNPNDKYGVSTTPGTNNKYGVSTTSGYNNDEDNENDEETPDNQDEDRNDEGTLESSIPPEKHSKITQLLGIARGEKGAKRDFLKGLFGLKKKDKAFKQGHKLPDSSYKLDKDDANSMKDLESEISKYNKIIT